ncbi:MAG: hypothetical protein RLZZ196_872 [Bacteroidota bacterium]|jgi:glycosyltransferase involved in cell wall biosynthesis
MKISLYIPRSGLNPAVGFGYAAQHIVNSLHKLGHEVRWSDPNSQIQLNFTQPHLYKMHRGQYQIGYTPWESTGMRKDWADTMNICDEVWATSNWNAEVFKNNGVTKDIMVYPHGIEDVWKPYKRQVGEVFRFLHVGEPAPRKSGQMTVDVFGKLFGNNPKYHLTVKAHNTHTLRSYNKYGQLVFPTDIYNNITIIKDEYNIDQLVNLFHRHHCLIYPTWGEGFGFIPLQALASGMPTITTYQWAEYKEYIGPLKLKSQLTTETLPKAVGDPHVGKMFKPDESHLAEQMFDVVENFKAYSGYYYAQSTEIHEKYNWLKLTKNAFKHLEEKF